MISMYLSAITEGIIHDFYSALGFLTLNGASNLEIQEFTDNFEYLSRNSRSNVTIKEILEQAIICEGV